MKRFVAIILTLAFLLSLVGCGSDKDVSSNPGKRGDNSVVGKIVGGVGATAEYIQSAEEKSVGEVSGTHSVTVATAAELNNEIIPTWENAYKINNMSGGSDSQATSLREKILNAKDSVKISGTKYYVSSLNGDDENDGLSPSTAIKTLIGAAKLPLKSGDALLLERGSVFRISGSFNLKSGVTYAAYGTGNKPAVYGSSMNYAIAGLWEPFQNLKNVWVLNMAFSGDVGNIVFNHGEAASNRIDYIYNMTKNGDFYYDSSACKLYLFLDKGNPANVYKDIEISSRFILFALPTGGHDITIDNITLKYSGNFAIRGIQLSNIKVTNCEVAWIGGALLPNGNDTYGNGIEVGGIENSVFKNNWVYQIYDSGMTFQLSQGDAINVSYSENLFEYCGMSGFEWWITSQIGTVDYAIKDVSFDSNVIRFTGYGWINGTKRGARHIQGPFQTQDYPNMSNFVFSNNYFDCAQGGITFFKWFTPSVNREKIIWHNNTYYQKKTDLGVGCIYGYGENVEDITYYVSNQKTLEAAVNTFESSPKHVEWIG